MACRKIFLKDGGNSMAVLLSDMFQFLIFEFEKNALELVYQKIYEKSARNVIRNKFSKHHLINWVNSSKDETCILKN